MKTRSRRGSLWRFVILLMPLALVAAACGDDDGGDAAPPADDSPSTTDEDAAQGLEGLESGEPLKIGVVLTFSGPVGVAGEQQFRGLEIAVEEINADGGIAGHPVELVSRDDGGEPSQAVAVTRELVEREDVQIVFGPTLTSPALAMAPYTTSEGVTMLTSASADQVDNPDEFPYLFSGSPNATTQVQAMVRFGQEVFGGQTPGVLLEATGYGDSLLPAFREALTAAGVAEDDIVVERHEQGAPDLTPQINALRDAGVDVFYHGGIGADNVRIPRTVVQVGWDVPVVGNQSTQTNADAIVEEVGGEDKASNIYAIYFRNQTYPPGGEPPTDVVAFHEKVVEAAGEERASVSQEGMFYDMAFVLKKALEQAGSLDAEALREALEDITHEGIYIDWDFTPDRHAGPTPDEMVITRVTNHQSGAWEQVE